MRADGNGNTHSYFPYGGLLGGTLPAADQVGFATYQYDASSGLFYAGQRHYNQSAGQFLTPDPSGMAAVDLKNPTSWNINQIIG